MKIATAVESWSSVRRCASVMRASSARIASTSVTSMPMPALPPGDGPVDHLEDAARAGDDHRQARLVGTRRSRAHASRPRARPNRGVPRLRVDRVGAVARLDGARIGGIDPGQPPGRIARPHRRGQRFEQLPDRIDVAAQLLMIGGKLGQLALGAGQVLDAQHRAAADGAAFDRDMAMLRGRQREREALALARAAHRPRPPSRAPCRARARCRRRARGAAAACA